MKNGARRMRATAAAVLVSFTSAGLWMPVSQAGMVSNAEIFAPAQVQDARDRVAAALARADVRQALAARGVDATQVESRVAALTDEEVNRVAGQLDNLPAGGDALGVVVLLFLVLLITDILGVTDVFPFVKKHR